MLVVLTSLIGALLCLILVTVNEILEEIKK